MANRQDLLLDDDFDLRIEDGDLVVGESDDQHVQLNLLSSPGEWRQFPLIGPELTKQLNSPLDGNRLVKLKAKVNGSLQRDGYTLKEFKLNEDSSLSVKV